MLEPKDPFSLDFTAPPQTPEDEASKPPQTPEVADYDGFDRGSRDTKLGGKAA